MRYLRFTAIRAREYHRALHSLDFLGCLTKREFKRVYYNGSSALRGVRMPPIPTLLESYKPGLTPAKVIANRHTLMAKMQTEIDFGRATRAECLTCGAKLTKQGLCPNGHGLRS
jgi:hypothetical protein